MQSIDCGPVSSKLALLTLALRWCVCTSHTVFAYTSMLIALASCLGSFAVMIPTVAKNYGRNKGSILPTENETGSAYKADGGVKGSRLGSAPSFRTGPATGTSSDFSGASSAVSGNSDGTVRHLKRLMTTWRFVVATVLLTTGTCATHVVAFSGACAWISSAFRSLASHSTSVSGLPSSDLMTLSGSSLSLAGISMAASVTMTGLFVLAVAIAAVVCGLAIFMVRPRWLRCLLIDVPLSVLCLSSRSVLQPAHVALAPVGRDCDGAGHLRHALHGPGLCLVQVSRRGSHLRTQVRPVAAQLMPDSR